jgi:ATP diphosphatase
MPAHHLVADRRDHVAANLARHAKVDVGAALRGANLKFERRFRAMEAMAKAGGVRLEDLPLEAQDRYWERAKRGT